MPRYSAAMRGTSTCNSLLLCDVNFQIKLILIKYLNISTDHIAHVIMISIVMQLKFILHMGEILNTHLYA